MGLSPWWYVNGVMGIGLGDCAETLKDCFDCCPWLYPPRFSPIILPTVGAILSGNTHKVCFMMQLSFYDVLCGYIGNGSIAKLANSMHVVVLQGFEETYWEPQNCWKFCIIVVACDFEDRKKRVCCFCRAGGGGGEWGWSGGTVQNVLHAFCQQFQREPKQGHQLAWKCSKAWNYFHL